MLPGSPAQSLPVAQMWKVSVPVQLKPIWVRQPAMHAEETAEALHIPGVPPPRTMVSQQPVPPPQSEGVRHWSWSSVGHEAWHATVRSDGSAQQTWPEVQGFTGQPMPPPELLPLPPPLLDPLPEPELPLEPPLPELPVPLDEPLPPPLLLAAPPLEPPLPLPLEAIPPELPEFPPLPLPPLPELPLEPEALPPSPAPSVEDVPLQAASAAPSTSAAGPTRE